MDLNQVADAGYDSLSERYLKLVREVELGEDYDLLKVGDRPLRSDDYLSMSWKG